MHAKLNKKIEKSVGKPNTLGVKGLKDKSFKFLPKSASFFYLHKNANLSNKTLILLVIFCKTRAGHTQQQSRQKSKVVACCTTPRCQNSILTRRGEHFSYFSVSLWPEYVVALPLVAMLKKCCEPSSGRNQRTRTNQMRKNWHKCMFNVQLCIQEMLYYKIK